MKPFCLTTFRLTVLILCGTTLLATVNGCHRSPSPDVMATVNGKEILRSELEKYYQSKVGENQQKPSAEQADIVRLEILKGLIDEEIL